MDIGACRPMQDITNMLGGSRSCPEVPKAGSLRGPGPAALGHRRSRRYNPCPSLPTSTAPRRERVTWREVPCIGAPSRFLTHTHTLAHTLAALARARGIRTSQPKTRARTPRPTEFSISSSSKLLGRSPPPLSARIPAPSELRCPPSLKARPVRPLSDAGISHQGLPSVFPGPSGVLGVSPGGRYLLAVAPPDASNCPNRPRPPLQALIPSRPSRPPPRSALAQGFPPISGSRSKAWSPRRQSLLGCSLSGLRAPKFHTTRVPSSPAPAAHPSSGPQQPAPDETSPRVPGPCAPSPAPSASPRSHSPSGRPPRPRLPQR